MELFEQKLLNHFLWAKRQETKGLGAGQESWKCRGADVPCEILVT